MRNVSQQSANQLNPALLQDNDVYRQIVLTAALKFAAEYMVNHILSDAPFSEKQVRLFVTTSLSAAVLAYEFSFIGLAIAAATLIATLSRRAHSQSMQSCFFMFSLCTKFSPLNLLASVAANKVGGMLAHCMWQHDDHHGVKHHFISREEDDADARRVAAFVEECKQ